MIAVFGFLVAVAAIIGAALLAPFDRGQQWVENCGIACGLAFFGGAFAFAGSMLWWLGEFLLAYAP